MEGKLKLRRAKRDKATAASEQVRIKGGVRALLTSGLDFSKSTVTLKGQDKVNQLILEQIAKLQNFMVEQVSKLSEELGISEIELNEPLITIPPAATLPKDLNLPPIPSSFNTDIRNLVLSPIKVEISKLSTVNTLIEDQFTEQLKTYDFETLGDTEKEAALTLSKKYAKQLSMQWLQGQKPPYCPSPEKSKELLKKLNNLLSKVEDTSRILNITSMGLNTLTQVANGTLTAISALSLIKIAANQATKALPFTPGIITSLIVDLGDGLQIMKEKPDGTPRMPKIKNALSTGATYITVAAVIMNAVVKILTIFIEILKSCGEEPNEIGEQTKKVIEQDEVRQGSNTNESYNGFTFEIVDRVLPNDPTVIRRAAQAINTEGIVGIETEPSFTQNPKILIEELKLIIDRDNLKAY